jgi:hypothetical protein
MSQLKIEVSVAKVLSTGDGRGRPLVLTGLPIVTSSALSVTTEPVWPFSQILNVARDQKEARRSGQSDGEQQRVDRTARWLATGETTPAARSCNST